MVSIGGLCQIFAAVNEPLTNILKKDARFVWLEACDRAFDAPFKLAVDACDIGIGAVLLQAEYCLLDEKA